MLVLLPPENRRSGPKDAENQPRLPLQTVLSAALPSLETAPAGVAAASVRLMGTSEAAARSFGAGPIHWSQFGSHETQSPILVEELFELIRQLNTEGLTILLVEQNVAQSLDIAHRAYVMENGAIRFSGKPGELLGNPVLKRAYLGG